MRLRDYTKPIGDGGKQRRQGKERGARLSESAERVRRAEDEHQLNPQIRIESGGCTESTCGIEAACIPVNQGRSHYCVCPHDRQPPTADLKCPNRSIERSKSHTVKYAPAHTRLNLPRASLPVVANDSQPMLGSGGCTESTCGTEAACTPVEQGRSHYCVCPHDRQPPTADLKCPNRSIVPVVQGNPIRNVIPPRGTNSSASPPLTSVSDYPPSAEVSMSAGGLEAEGDGELGGGTLAAAGGGALLLVLVAVALAACYARRRAACLHSGKTPQRVRPGEPLLAERYITNPQYGVCAGTAPGGGAAPGNTPAHPGADTPHAVPHLDRAGLTFLEEVGEGCFGKVHKGLLRQGSGEQVVAIKVLKDSAGRTAEEDFIREVTIMSAFQHHNILALIGVVYREEVGASPWMVFEYMEWGDLAGVLRGARAGAPALDPAALLHVAVQIAKGMTYLAARRFVHRDLAARNCLVGSHITVKIADFGMSRDVYTCDYYKMGGERPMPVRWMSPESIVYARFTLESDVWSFGVVLWEIYSRGKQPFYGHNNDGATKLILQGIMLVPPEDCPRFACELMRACWRSDPRDRVRFEEICRKLEAAATASGEIRSPLPRPPVTPLDAEGYLVPADPPLVDYLATIPDPDSDSSEDPDEYT